MKVKLCGMKSVEAAQAAVEAGADFIGFIFYPPSSRNVSPGQAAAICDRIGYKARKVGVFVDEEIHRVKAIAGLCNLDFIQLHGHEDAAYIRQIRQPVIKAVRYHEGLSHRMIDKLPADLILIDAGNDLQPGGTGKPFNWQQAAKDIRRIQHSVLIAGGIQTSNLQQVWDTFHPYGVDASSGLETNGVKDVAKIREFMQEVKCINATEAATKEMVI